MPGGENDFESHATPVRRHEYNPESSTRHRSINGIRRLIFFNLASIWGFIVGVAGLLAGMSASGQPAQPGARIIVGLVVSFVLAAAGGFVMSAAYRESKRRSR
jgi:putative flippase GtrA